MTGKFSTEQIARVLHNANATLCALMGDFSQVPWEKSPTAQKQSTIDCIEAIKANPDVPSSELHDKWIDDMKANGWAWGPVKDVNKKTHPCCLPYDECPDAEKVKDRLFKNIVLAML